MNYTLLNATRSIHLKIVAVSLVCATIVVLVGIHARTADVATSQAQLPNVTVKAGQPATYAGHEASTVR